MSLIEPVFCVCITIDDFALIVNGGPQSRIRKPANAISASHQCSSNNIY
jgi:hypothetical protein